MAFDQLDALGEPLCGSDAPDLISAGGLAGIDVPAHQNDRQIFLRRQPQAAVVGAENRSITGSVAADVGGCC